jgi:hypothetical protein
MSPRSKSKGEHESVQAYREKLESIADNTVPEAEELNRRLEQYLKDIQTPPAPPPDDVA